MHLYHLSNFASKTISFPFLKTLLNINLMESFMFSIETFNSVEQGFKALEQVLDENDKGKIYDVLIRLKQAIFSKNPYSIVLGNISEWIDFIPRMEWNFKIKGLLYKSLDAWRYYANQSLQEGVPVTSRI